MIMPMNELIIPSVVRWIHIASAVALVGGFVAVHLVVLPALKRALEGQQADSLRDTILTRWRKVVMLATAGLLVSGFYNFLTFGLKKAKAAEEAMGVGLYHPIFGGKFLAALFVFVLVAALAGRSSVFEGLRARPGKWVALTVALGVIVLLLGAFLKSMPS